MSDDARRLLSCAAVARRLGLSPRTVRRMMEAGTLPFRRINGRRRMTLADLDGWLRDGAGRVSRDDSEA